MSTIKISELPKYSTINSNTSNTLFVGVDTPTDTTYQFTAHTLAQGLYANEVLNVGINTNTLPNTVAQFALGGNSYIQTNLVNTNDGGSADMVVTANVGSGGTDSAYFMDMGLANKNYSPGNEFNNIGTSIYPLDGYLYMQGLNGTSPGGNLIVGTTTSNTELRLIVGGGTVSNIVAKFTSTGLVLNTQSYLTFADGTKQSTAGAPYAYSNAAFLYANTQVALLYGVDVTQNTSITAAFTQANAAFLYANTQVGLISGVDLTQNTRISASFDKANNALANTSGAIFNGDLTITGNLISRSIATSNLVSFVGSNTPSTNALVEIVGSVNGIQQTPSQDGYMLHITGKANVATRLIMDAFGVANNYNVLAGRGARGTALTPGPTQNNDVMMRISSNGWGSTNFAPLGVSKIDFVAAENYTDTARGSRIEFWNVKIGSNTLTEIASFNGERVTFTGHVEPTRGFVYTATNLVGPQTAITIDVANNSIVKANMAASCAVTLSNFYKGKSVELWLTNTAGGNQVFTHGCSALNSTVNATTYTIPGTSTILVKYMSFETDLANTFVSIVHT
jgi:hypothetical protein